MSDAQERTEKATERHLKEVRRKGRLSRSHDLPSWIGLGATALTLPLVVGHAAQASVAQLLTVTGVIADPDPARALAALGAGLGSVLPTLGVLLGVAVLAVIASSLIQGGFRFRALTLKAENLDLAKGVTRLFGGQALWQGAKSVLKAGAVGLALWLVVRALEPELLASGARPVPALVAVAEKSITWLLVAAIAAGLAIAAFDVLVVMRRNRKQTMMTKREVRDEMKNTEGDPLVRQQRRARHLAATRGSMVQAVESASVVLVNPTSYAVALLYEPGSSAPRVVAKGKGELAARIRQTAARHRVPLVRDVPLTRALHAQVAVGREIPPEFYTQIAQVLAFVAMLKARGAASGVRDNPHASSATRASAPESGAAS
ncbi:flagellar biosynthesis protein FlhB [Gryllotalpicola kribbensis]|uniref:Flagellar biosynthesis protein FlhB n=1 Tax=Gryllotalpicola kribbensis TaxID=993084 RepID=A0ABP8AKT9_9MICO